LQQEGNGGKEGRTRGRRKRGGEDKRGKLGIAPWLLGDRRPCCALAQGL